MKSKRAQEGWLLIDNRHGPNMTLEEAAKTKREIVGAGVNGVYESATVTCAHCHQIVVLNPQRTRERGYCSKCDHYVCDKPECNVVCSPLHRILDHLQEQLARQERLSSGGIILPGAST